MDAAMRGEANRIFSGEQRKTARGFEANVESFTPNRQRLIQVNPLYCAHDRYGYVQVNIWPLYMPRRRSKSPQRAFPWREILLAALRQDPRMNLACKAARISRNTAYQHLRNDGRFRCQWEHARSQGEDVAYRLPLRQLAADPVYQRALERFRLIFGSEGKRFLLLKNLVH
jgi:hypothetical protein